MKRFQDNNTYKSFQNTLNNLDIFTTENMDFPVEITPEMPDFLWISSSVVFGFEFCLGAVTNLTVVFSYIRNVSVR